MDQKITCVLSKYVEGRVTPIIVSKGAPDEVMTAFQEEINKVPLFERARYEKGLIERPRVDKHCILYAVVNPGTDIYRIIEYRESCGKKRLAWLKTISLFCQK